MCGDIAHQIEVYRHYFIYTLVGSPKVLTLMSRISKVRRAIRLLFNQYIGANNPTKQLYRYPFNSLNRRDICCQIYIN